MSDLTDRLRLGASISRERNLNIDYARVADEAADEIDRLRAEVAGLREAEEMDAVAIRYAHKLALDLECVLSNYIGPWYDTAMQTISDYRMAMNRIHEHESPTFMGEPLIPRAKP
mgnify:CR=1 FL=1